MKRTLRQALHFVQPLCSVDCFTFCMLVQLIFKTAGFVPDVIRSCSKALLATQRQTASIHQVTKELPARGHLITIQALCLGHSAQQQSYPAWKTNVTHTTVLKKILKIKINQTVENESKPILSKLQLHKVTNSSFAKIHILCGFFCAFFLFLSCFKCNMHSKRFLLLIYSFIAVCEKWFIIYLLLFVKNVSNIANFL